MRTEAEIKNVIRESKELLTDECMKNPRDERLITKIQSEIRALNWVLKG
jgi:hypothetical protein